MISEKNAVFDYKSEKRINIPWTIQNLWEQMNYALSQGDTNTYTNLVTVGLYNILSPVFDPLFIRELNKLQMWKLNQKRKFNKNGRYLISTREEDEINFKYAAEMAKMLNDMIYREHMYPRNIIHENADSEQSELVDYVKRKIFTKNENWLSVFTGPPGSGKSYSAISFAYKIDKTFTADRIIFTPNDFLKLINELEQTKSKGKFIVFDEAGSGLNARKWQSLSNTIVADEIETFRYLNLGVIFTLPVFTFFDSKPRKLTNSLIRLENKNEDTKKATLRWSQIDVNPKDGEIFFPDYVHPKTGNPLKTLDIGMPPKEIYEPYEEKKRAYLKTRRKNSIQKLDFMQDDKDKAPDDELIEKVMGDLDTYKSMRGGVSSDSLEHELGITQREARRLKYIIDKKIRLEAVTKL